MLVSSQYTNFRNCRDVSATCIHWLATQGPCLAHEDQNSAILALAPSKQKIRQSADTAFQEVILHSKVNLIFGKIISMKQTLFPNKTVRTYSIICLCCLFVNLNSMKFKVRSHNHHFLVNRNKKKKKEKNSRRSLSLGK